MVSQIVRVHEASLFGRKGAEILFRVFCIFVHVRISEYSRSLTDTIHKLDTLSRGVVWFINEITSRWHSFRPFSPNSTKSMSK